MEPFNNYFRDIKITSVLDVGTGKGGYLPVLVQAFPDAKITAIDPDAGALKVARQKFPEIVLLEMQAEKLLFDSDSFDVVSISMALHHLPKVKKGLREMRRVVKSGGWIIVNEMISNNLNPAQEVHKLYHHFRSRIDSMTGIYHRKSFTKDAILQMLKEAGIQVQFLFEHKRNINMVENIAELENKVQKMEQMLEKIKERPEYYLMKPEIEIFRSRALKYGLQPATKLIVVARKKTLS